MPIYPIFCAAEQTDTDQELTRDELGELIAVCGCGRVLKFPNDATSDELTNLLIAHKEANLGQDPVAPPQVADPAADPVPDPADPTVAVADPVPDPVVADIVADTPIQAPVDTPVADPPLL